MAKVSIVARAAASRFSSAITPMKPQCGVSFLVLKESLKTHRHSSFTVKTTVLAQTNYPSYHYV